MGLFDYQCTGSLGPPQEMFDREYFIHNLVTYLADSLFSLYLAGTTVPEPLNSLSSGFHLLCSVI